MSALPSVRSSHAWTYFNVFSFFNQRLLIELFYNRYITGIILRLGSQTTKVLDKGSVVLLGPFGLEKGLLNHGVVFWVRDSHKEEGLAMCVEGKIAGKVLRVSGMVSSTVWSNV